uniref:Uncharacterized protein n=1 Tax=Pogona vitticeps TaxID=103695 RepID=A0ABM5EU24_9SAUR
MLGWVERVVPQPPASSPIHKIMQEGTQATPDARAALAGQAPDGSERSPAAGSKKVEVAESHNAVSTTESVGQGVLVWLSQGLGKVVPQPAHNAPIAPVAPLALQAGGKSFEASFDIPDVTELQSIKLDDDDLEVTVLEPDEEDLSELQSSSDNNAPDKTGSKQMLSWLKDGFGKMLPKPENLKRMEEEASEQIAEMENKPRTSYKVNFLPSPPSDPGLKPCDSAVSLSSLSISLFPRTLGGDGGSLFEWFVHGLEKVMPQPVTPTKQARMTTQATDMGPGQERCKGA